MKKWGHLEKYVQTNSFSFCTWGKIEQVCLWQVIDSNVYFCKSVKASERWLDSYHTSAQLIKSSLFTANSFFGTSGAATHLPPLHSQTTWRGHNTGIFQVVFRFGRGLYNIDKVLLLTRPTFQGNSDMGQILPCKGLTDFEAYSAILLELKCLWCFLVSSLSFLFIIFSRRMKMNQNERNVVPVVPIALLLNSLKICNQLRVFIIVEMESMHWKLCRARILRKPPVLIFLTLPDAKQKYALGFGV